MNNELLLEIVSQLNKGKLNSELRTDPDFNIQVLAECLDDFSAASSKNFLHWHGIIDKAIESNNPEIFRLVIKKAPQDILIGSISYQNPAHNHGNDPQIL